jgi:hypothetical protein
LARHFLFTWFYCNTWSLNAKHPCKIKHIWNQCLIVEIKFFGDSLKIWPGIVIFGKSFKCATQNVKMTFSSKPTHPISSPFMYYTRSYVYYTLSYTMVLYLQCLNCTLRKTIDICQILPAKFCQSTHPNVILTFCVATWAWMQPLREGGSMEGITEG